MMLILFQQFSFRYFEGKTNRSKWGDNDENSMARD